VQVIMFDNKETRPEDALTKRICTGGFMVRV